MKLDMLIQTLQKIQKDMDGQNPEVELHVEYDGNTMQAKAQSVYGEKKVTAEKVTTRVVIQDTL